MAPLSVARPSVASARVCVRAAPLRPSGLRRARPLLVTPLFATPEKVQSALTEALQAAEECVGDCAVEWDTVEELSAAANKTIDEQPAADSGNRISASDAAKIQMCVLLPFLFLFASFTIIIIYIFRSVVATFCLFFFMIV